MAPLTSV